MMILPTSVDPVNATFAGIGVTHHRGAGSPLPGHEITTPAGDRILQYLASLRQVTLVVSAGLRTRNCPGQRRRELHASMSSGKFHGMTCPTTPRGATRRPGARVQFVRPAGVIEEVAAAIGTSKSATP